MFTRSVCLLCAFYTEYFSAAACALVRSVPIRAVKRIARILSMARFGNVAELATFLGKLDADYAEYAPAWWQKGIKTP
ncbi:hypothetical protein WJX79_001887 [Trebouxia sp. C0005]